MRANVIKLLLCLCVLGGAQALQADPDSSFRFDGLSSEDVWMKNAAVWSLADGKLILKAAPNTVSLIQSNSETVKPSQWFGYTCDLIAKNGTTLDAGLAFGIKDEKNYWKFVVRGQDALLIEVKEGTEIQKRKFALAKALGEKVTLRVELFPPSVFALRVNDEQLNSEILDLGIPTGGLGLVSSMPLCSFQQVGASGIAKR